MEGRGLALGNLAHLAEKFAGGRLIKARLLLHAVGADGLQDAQRAQGVHIGRVFRHLEAHGHVAHGAQVVHLVGLAQLQQAVDVRGVGKVAVVQHEVALAQVRVLVDVVHAAGIEHGRAALDAVDDVAFLQQQLRQERAVLPGYAGDERNLLAHATLSFLPRVSSGAQRIFACQCRELPFLNGEG